MVQTLDTTHPGEGDGLAFDSSGNLYATAGFSANTMVKFDNTGTLLTANFGSGYNSHPESVVIDNTNKVLYVGQPDGSHQVLKFDFDGNPLANYSPAIQDRGTDWVDLAADLHTIRYTSEGDTIFQYDLATNTQLANFNAVGLTGSNAYAHRILSDGGELVADTSQIVRLDSAGNVVKTYTIPSISLLFAINLDPDGTSFWTADYLTIISTSLTLLRATSWRPSMTVVREFSAVWRSLAENRSQRSLTAQCHALRLRINRISRGKFWPEEVF